MSKNSKQLTRCDHCDEAYRLSPAAKGKTVKCKACENTFIIRFVEEEPDNFGQTAEPPALSAQPPERRSRTPTFDRAATAVVSKTNKLAEAVSDEVTPERKSKAWRYFFDENHSSALRYQELDWSRRVLHFVGRLSWWIGAALFILGILYYFIEGKWSLTAFGFSMMVEGFFSLVASQMLRVYLDIERNTRVTDA